MMEPQQSELSGLLQRLTLSEKPVDVLNKLSVCVANLNLQSGSAQNVSAAPIFDRLMLSENKEVRELCCHVLSKLLELVPYNIMLQSYHEYFLNCLRSKEMDMKYLALTQLRRCNSPEHVDVLMKMTSMMSAVVSCISDPELLIAKQACTVVKSVGTISERHMHRLFTDPFLSGFHDVMASSDVVRFRVYELLVDIGRESEAAFQQSVFSNLLPPLLEEFRKPDVLVQLNCLEILAGLADTGHGMKWLTESGAMDTISKLISSSDISPFLLPGLIKFFAGVAYVEPKLVTSKYHAFLPTVFSLTDGADGDAALQCLAIDTVGLLGRRPDGKLALAKYPVEMKSALSSIWACIKTAPSNLRLSALTGFAHLISLESEEDQTTELLDLTRSWYMTCDPSPTATLAGVCRLPFDDLRCAGLLVVRALATQEWGQREINDCPGFVEMLLDRGAIRKCDRSVKLAVHDVVKALAASPSAASVFDAPVFMRLRVREREGPDHVEAVAQVALEGQG